MEDLTPKQFLTQKIDYDLLDVCFYSDIEEGEYLVIEAINYSVYDVIIFPEKRRGWYEFFFLIYSQSQKKLMRLYPCHYTRRKMKEYFKRLKEDEEFILTLQKDKKKLNVRRPPAPKWREVCIYDYFKHNQVFRPINEYENVELVFIRLLSAKEIFDKMFKEEKEKENKE